MEREPRHAVPIPAEVYQEMSEVKKKKGVSFVHMIVEGWRLLRPKHADVLNDQPKRK